MNQKIKETISKATAAEIIRCWRYNAIPLPNGGANLLINGKVIMAIHPPFSPLRKGWMVANSTRKTGWRIYCF